MGDKGRQDLGKEGGHTIQQREARRKTSWETRGETSWETRWETGTRVKKPPEGGHAIQQRETRRETRETKPREGRHTIQQRETRRGIQWETKGDKTLGKADTPSNKGKQEGRQWETRGDKTSGRRMHHPTTVGRLVNARREASPYMINIILMFTDLLRFWIECTQHLFNIYSTYNPQKTDI